MNAATSKLLSAREIIELRGMVPRTRGASGVRAQFYEGSRWSPDRSFIWEPMQTAKKDLDKWTRGELNKASEKLWKDSPFFRGIVKRLVTLIIGCGAMPTAKSSSPEFNAEVKTFLRKTFRRPCVDGKKSFGNYQRRKMTGMLKHGESYTVFVTDPLTSQDKLQGFESHKCCSAGGQPARKNDTLSNGLSQLSPVRPPPISASDDGIDFYATGFPKQYRFLGMDTPVPESLVVHHALIERDEQTHGETIFAAALNSGRDVHEILALEKQAVKDASGKQDIIQTQTGDYDPETLQKSLIGGGFAGANFAGANTFSDQDDPRRAAYYNSKFSGSPVLLKTGDKYTPYIPARPGSAWEGFMAFLANIIVLSTGLPPSLVLPIDIGGTDIRRDLQIGQKVVEIFQSEFEDDLQVISEYFIQGGIEDRVFKSKIPADWNTLEWHFTGSLTVDRNKDQVRMQLVEAGLMSRNEYHGENGVDGEEQLQEVVKEVKRTRFLVTDIPETEPFASATEFKQFLNLSETSSLTFRETNANGGEGDAGSGGETLPGKNKNPAERDPALRGRQLQPA
jgi:hypothetical protein